MDAIRFDRATRLLSERYGRRRLFGPIAAGAATYLVAFFGDSNRAAGAAAGSQDSGDPPAGAMQRSRKRRGRPAVCRGTIDANGRCSAGGGTPAPTPQPTCLAGGDSCRIDPNTGMPDFSQCCSGTGVSSLANPCLCCESGRTGVREAGEYCYPQAGNQCCLGQCGVLESEFYGICG